MRLLLSEPPSASAALMLVTRAETSSKSKSTVFVCHQEG
jgi:hypothetical protein